MWFQKENLSKVSVKTFGQNVRLEKGLGFRASSLPTQFFKMWVQKENLSKHFGQNFRSKLSVKTFRSKLSVETFRSKLSVKTFRSKLSVKTFGQNVFGTQTLNNFYINPKLTLNPEPYEP